MSTKVCSRCQIARPLDQFDSDASKQGGRYPSCKTCKRRTRKTKAASYRARTQKERDAARRALHPTGRKYCSWHKANHLLSEFGPDPGKNDGLNPVCRLAAREKQRASRNH